MNQIISKSPGDIRAARALHSEMRERDFARIQSITEAELVAAYVGENVIALRPDVETLLNGLTTVGEVMALTRNESAVHEKIGPYEKVVFGPMASMVLGEQIDLRIFPRRWAFGFAVEKTTAEGEIRRSLQFFNAQGDAVHKVHARPATNIEAWNLLVTNLRSTEQNQTVTITPLEVVPPAGPAGTVDQLREKWAAMTDTHQFFGMLQKLNITRHQAMHMVGDDYAWPLDHSAAAAMFDAAAADGLPIMAFVGNGATIQIHAGPVKNIKLMGPWLNVMDETFHLHLRLDQIAEIFAVRKPTSDGFVTSVEAYGQDKELIIQFFGKRIEGADERPQWRAIVEALPNLDVSSAA